MAPGSPPRRSPRKTTTPQDATPSPSKVTKRTGIITPFPKERPDLIRSHEPMEIDTPSRQQYRDEPDFASKLKNEYSEHLSAIAYKLLEADGKGDSNTKHEAASRINRLVHKPSEPTTITGWIKQIEIGLAPLDGPPLKSLNANLDEVANFILQSVFRPWALEWHLFDKAAVAGACTLAASKLCGSELEFDRVDNVIEELRDPWSRGHEDEYLKQTTKLGRPDRGVDVLKRAVILVNMAVEAKGGWAEVLIQALEEQVIGPKASIFPGSKPSLGR